MGTNNVVTFQIRDVSSSLGRHLSLQTILTFLVIAMVPATPGNPGKLVEFCNFFPELWKTSRKAYFPCTLEFSWNSVENNSVLLKLNLQITGDSDLQLIFM